MSSNLHHYHYLLPGSLYRRDLPRYVSTSFCLYLSMYPHLSICTYLCIHIFLFVPIYVSTSFCVYLSMYPHLSVCTYLCIHIFLFVPIHVSQSFCLYLHPFTISVCWIWGLVLPISFYSPNKWFSFMTSFSSLQYSDILRSLCVSFTSTFDHEISNFSLFYTSLFHSDGILIIFISRDQTPS